MSEIPNTRNNMSVVEQHPAEKKEVSVQVRAASSERPSSSEQDDTESTWETGVWKRFPWAGLSALITIILCSVGAVLILYYSDGTSATTWANGKLAPNVVLSVLNNLSNLAITLAVGQGIAINWWRRALSGGTVKQLHYAWSFSSGISSIFKKLTYFNVIALAALMTKLAVIDGVLYQKATTTYMDQDDVFYNETVMMFGANTFPITGKIGSAQGLDDGTLQSEFATLAGYWNTIGFGINQWTNVYNCNGMNCKFGMEGAGFAVNCTTQNSTVDYGTSARAAFNASNGTATAYSNLTLFSVAFARNWPTADKNYSSLRLDATHPVMNASQAALHGACPMTLQHTTCELRPAILNYTVFYTNQSSVARSQQKKDDPIQDDSALYNSEAFASGPYITYTGEGGTQLSYNCKNLSTGCTSYRDSWQQLKGIRVQRYLDIKEDFAPGQLSQLEGLFLAYDNALTSKASLSYNGSDWFVDSDGIMATINAKWDTPAGFCNYSYKDPLDLVLRQVNNLALMTIQYPFLYYNPYYIYDSDTNSRDWYSNTTSPLFPVLDSSLYQNHTYTSWVQYKEIFYQSNFHYVWGALAATLVVVACILPVYWGFWELGRKVTLGPIEIANAFQGPAFADVKGDHVEEVLKNAGRRRVVYGHIDVEDGKRLAFTTTTTAAAA